MEVLGELPDQFVDYQVMKDNERHKIYMPEEPAGGYPTFKIGVREDTVEQLALNPDYQSNFIN